MSEFVSKYAYFLNMIYFTLPTGSTQRAPIGWESYARDFKTHTIPLQTPRSERKSPLRQCIVNLPNKFNTYSNTA